MYIQLQFKSLTLQVVIFHFDYTEKWLYWKETWIFPQKMLIEEKKKFSIEINEEGK